MTSCMVACSKGRHCQCLCDAQFHGYALVMHQARGMRVGTFATKCGTQQGLQGQHDCTHQSLGAVPRAILHDIPPKMDQT